MKDAEEGLVWGEGKVTYLQMLLNSVEPETFSREVGLTIVNDENGLHFLIFETKKVLPLFQDTSSDLIHAKVMSYLAPFSIKQQTKITKYS